MALAFELPDHLPRAQPQDKSTHVVSKIAQATNKTLDASLATSWLVDLESSIQDTKGRIFKRIHDDLPAFERQLISSTSIRTRFDDLSTTVDGLAEMLNNPKTGILPTLLQTLTAHRTLSEQTQELDVTHRAVSHLLRIWEQIQQLSTRVEEGNLPESAQACVRVQELVTEAPCPLDKAEIMNDIKKRYRTLNDHVQEQLGDAYTRSITVSDSVDCTILTILPSARVLPTLTRVTLPAILQSLNPNSLSARLSAFRRELIAKFVDPILLTSCLVTTSISNSSPTLSLSSLSSSPVPLQSLRTLLDFLQAHLSPHLPHSQAHFSTALHSSIISAVLIHLLQPSIPSSLPGLPAFLDIVDDAVRFEESLGIVDSEVRPIRHWADDIACHYEKKRRENVLRSVREVISRSEDGATSRSEISALHSSYSQAQSASDEPDADVSGWDFDDGVREDMGNSVDTPASQNTKPQNGVRDDAHPRSENVPSDIEDTSDVWGWGDGDEETDQANSQQVEALSPQGGDDPWDDDGWLAQPTPNLPPLPGGAPRLATRLERFSAKAKGLNTPNSSLESPGLSHTPPPPLPHPSRTPPSDQRQKPVEKETYLISLRVKTVLEIAKDVMLEGKELLDSDVFADHSFGKTTIPGQLLATVGLSVLDLHRALYPVIHSSLLARDPISAMRWSNDCRFLSDGLANLKNLHKSAATEEKWIETSERLKTLSEECFEDVVTQQQTEIQHVLLGAEGFIEASDKERFDKCKVIVEKVLHKIMSVVQQWKETLTKSAYLRAAGLLVDDALFRVMDDILSLEDIPEADSKSLSELCEVLAPLEQLFIYDGEQSVVGSHVPLWFKFSYLPWLIRGSIADLSYLFDQGMLVDYEIEELVQLLRALFADTPLRETTIAKIAKGHPALAHGED